MSTLDDGPSAESSAAVARILALLRVVTGALIFGVISLLGIVFFLSGEDMVNEPEFMSWLGLGIGGLMFVQHLVVPNFIARAAIRKQGSLEEVDPDTAYHVLAQVFHTQHIVGSAMLEAGAILNVVFFITTNFIGNAVFAGVMALVMIVRLVMLSSAHVWIDEKYQQMS